MSSRVKQKQVNRAVREQLAKEAKRRRMLIVSIAAVFALVVAGVVGWAVYETQNNSSSSYLTPAHATSDKTGIVVSSGPVLVELYTDYLCPNCRLYEQQVGNTLSQLSQQGKIKLVYHPIAILDEDTTPAGYSTRAGSASGCAADAGKFAEYNTALFDNQPAEGSAGLDDAKLIQIGATAGLTDSSFGTCVKSGKYKGWVAHTTDAASERGVSGTPTVFVAGKRVQLSLDALTSAISAAGGELVSPTPSGSAAPSGAPGQSASPSR